MFCAVVSFCVMAIGIKEMSSQVSSFQIIFFRSLIGLITILIFFRKKVIKPNFLMIKDHLFRNFFHLIGQYGWIIGIVSLSLAEVTAIEFSVPIWILIIAFFFLKEGLTIQKVVSVILGFLGILAILQPSFEVINVKSVIVLLSAVSYAIAHTSTKKLTSKYTSLDIVFMMCLIQIPISFFFVFTDLSYPSLSDLFYLFIVGISAIIAHFTMAKAMEYEEISAIISIDYFRLPILVIIGILMYNEKFEILYLIGGTLIFVGNWINKRDKS